MQKYLIAVLLVVTFAIVGFYVYFARSVYIDFRPNAPVTVKFRAYGESIMQSDSDGNHIPVLLRGVEMPPSVPGYMARDFGADYYTYLRWFAYIDAMGANTIYVPGIMDPDFYNALYRFNRKNDRPLLILQGIEGYDYDSLTFTALKAIDVIHGRRINFLDRNGISIFLTNVSPWVAGFVVGTGWESDSIIFKNHFDPSMPSSFQGEFFSSAEDASRFEVMLARVMDRATEYEASRFKVQRPIGFISSPATDFLEYAPAYAAQLRKYAQLDAEHVVPTEAMVAGTFAAYRLFYFSENFIDFLAPDQLETLAPILADLDRSGVYGGYLELLARYHSMPVIATGFGFSTARAPYRVYRPPLTEREQGESLAWMTEQIEAHGWAGSIISTWQDSWERRTWNTAFSSDPWRYHYWHNLQAVDQGYGLMAFDPGRNSRPVLIDGRADEWNEKHLVHTYAGINIYAQYSLQGLYLLIRGEGVSPANTLYLPIDVTPKSGTSYFADMTFERPADFLLILSGRHNSRLLVNRRYHATNQRFYEEMTGQNPFTLIVPPQWDSEFVPITVVLQNTLIIDSDQFHNLTEELQELRRLRTWDTGALTHGIGDPASAQFNSLADFFFGENLVEIRLPWMLLNFYDPSSMRVHDDYYQRFGVEGIRTREIYIGIATTAVGVDAAMSPIPLYGWRNRVYTHERLKQSYFIMQELWRD